MKLTLILGIVSVITAVQAEIGSTENQTNYSNDTAASNTTSMTNSTSAWDGPVNITEPTPGTKWEAGSLHTVNWTLVHHNNTDNGTTGGNSTVPPGNNSTDGNVPPGNNSTDGSHGNDTDTNNTQTDHLSIQLAVGGNVQAVDLVFPLAHNVSKSNGTTQILIPQHIPEGKNFTLAVGQPDQGVSFVSGIDIEDNNKNGTHDKNGTVNPDQIPSNTTYK